MKIRVPENIGGELRILPDDTYGATVQDMFQGKSGTGNPKLTVKYVLTTDSTKRAADEASCIGENVLETFSLQEQALFNVNGLYKQCVGINIPQGDYDLDQFVEIIKKGCIGAELFITLKKEKNNKDQEVMMVESRAPKSKVAKVADKKFAKK